MADKKELTVEERLAKATECYKDIKARLDAANEKIAELEKNRTESADVTKLKNRVKELEDEITINGNSQEEVAKLTERLEKAKAIFAEQKAKIKDCEAATEASEKKVKELTERLVKADKVIGEIANTIANY